ncbi:MAG: hypothetical protein HYZ48_05200, partial [Chlamydiales bacterium]|nr:hypothetical protein [Chlamydiales bacterium]
FLFNQVFDLSSSAGFGVVGVFTLFVTCLLTMRLSELSLSFFSRKVLFPLCRFPKSQIRDTQDLKNTILILQKRNWKHALLLLGAIPHLHLIIPVKEKKAIPFLLRFFTCFKWIVSQSPDQMLISCQESLGEGLTPCLLAEEGFPEEIFHKANPLIRLFQGSPPKIAKVHFEKKLDGLTLQID